MKPKGNGIITMHDDKEIGNVGFFCMQLVAYLNEEAEMGTESYQRLWDARFASAKEGQCSYRDKCPVYAKTISRHTT